MENVQFAPDGLGDITGVSPDPCSPCQAENGTRLAVSTDGKLFRNRKAKFLSILPCKTKDDKEKPCSPCQAENGTRLAVSTDGKLFRNRKAKFLSTLPCKTKDDKEKPWITGATFLADERLVLVDYNNMKVKLYNHGLTYNSELVLDDKPFNVTAYEMNKIAITLINTSKIQLLSVIQKLCPSQAIFLPFQCDYLYGISSLSDDSFIVTAYNIVGVVDINGRQISQLRFDKDYLSRPINIALDATKSVAYVASYMNHKLCAVDITSNKILFTYQHDDMKYPRSVTLDKDDNLYVCCEGTHSVHQISAEGKLIQILLSQNDNVKSPTAVCFSNDGTRFLVTDLVDNETECVKIYEIE